MATVHATASHAMILGVPIRTVAIRMAEVFVGGFTFVVLLQTVLGFDLLDPSLWTDYDEVFWAGFFRTITYIVVILPVSVVLGFVLGWARVSRFRALAWPVAVYVEFFRGVPPIVIVIFAAVLGPQLLPERFRSVEIGLTMGAIAIAFHSAAFQAEIFRAGFQSVSHGQVEAAHAVGMRQMQTMGSVILPQALRLSLPPLANEFAVLIKDTSLITVVAGGELFHLSVRFQDTIIRQGANLDWLFVIWTAVALAYFVMTFTTTRFMLLIERAFRPKGLEGISI